VSAWAVYLEQANWVETRAHELTSAFIPNESRSHEDFLWVGAITLCILSVNAFSFPFFKVWETGYVSRLTSDSVFLGRLVPSLTWWCNSGRSPEADASLDQGPVIFPSLFTLSLSEDRKRKPDLVFLIHPISDALQCAGVNFHPCELLNILAAFMKEEVQTRILKDGRFHFFQRCFHDSAVTNEGQITPLTRPRYTNTVWIKMTIFFYLCYCQQNKQVISLTSIACVAKDR